MKNYPLDKYKFFVNDGKNKVIAISTYAGKTVKGTATCAEGDSFDLERGKMLAAARCAEKISRRRLRRAIAKLDEARKIEEAAHDYVIEMASYFNDAITSMNRAEENVSRLLEKF